MSSSRRGRAAELPDTCYVCGALRPRHRLTVRDGRLVCPNVQACTERVMNPPMWHEEFITDEQLDQWTRTLPGKVLPSIQAVLLVRPELRGAEIQVARDDMRYGWIVRAKR